MFCHVSMTVEFDHRSYPQVVLETEFDNAGALALYGSLGFMREKRLFRFYLNGKDAFRLVLPVASPDWDQEEEGDDGDDEE
jgi:peptide alpha-N-acetyltransferase